MKIFQRIATLFLCLTFTFAALTPTISQVYAETPASTLLNPYSTLPAANNQTNEQSGDKSASSQSEQQSGNNSNPKMNDATKSLQQQLFKDSFEKNKEDSNYMKRLLAQIVIVVPNMLIDLLNLQDYNQLIFNMGKEDEQHDGLFNANIWDAADKLYRLLTSNSAYLLVIAVICWGLYFLWRPFDPQTYSSLREMIRKLLIYVVGIYCGSYLFELVFEVNHAFIVWAETGLEYCGLDPHTDILAMFAELSATENLGYSLLFLFVTISIGMFNYHYAVRSVMILYLMINFPVTAYKSVFPGSQKSLDNWFREFAAQVLTQGGHAIAFALFLVLLKYKASSWILFAMLGCLPSLPQILIRHFVGAPNIPNGGGWKGAIGSALGNAVGAGAFKSLASIAGFSKGGLPTKGASSGIASNVAGSAKSLMSGMNSFSRTVPLPGTSMGGTSWSPSNDAASLKSGFPFPKPTNVDVLKQTGQSLTSDAKGMMMPALKKTAGFVGKTALYTGGALATGAMGGNPGDGIRAAHSAIGGINRMTSSVGNYAKSRNLPTASKAAWAYLRNGRTSIPQRRIPMTVSGGNRNYLTSSRIRPNHSARFGGSIPTRKINASRSVMNHPSNSSSRISSTSGNIPVRMKTMSSQRVNAAAKHSYSQRMAGTPISQRLPQKSISPTATNQKTNIRGNFIKTNQEKVDTGVPKSIKITQPTEKTINTETNSNKAPKNPQPFRPIKISQPKRPTGK